MLKQFYKVYLALHNHKLLDVCGLFAISYDTRMKEFVIWYIDSGLVLKYYDSCSSYAFAKFKWNILMCRGQENDIACLEATK